MTFGIDPFVRERNVSICVSNQIKLNQTSLPSDCAYVNMIGTGGVTNTERPWIADAPAARVHATTSLIAKFAKKTLIMCFVATQTPNPNK